MANCKGIKNYENVDKDDYNVFRNNYCKNIEFYLKANKMTQIEVENRCGLKQSTISHVLRRVGCSCNVTTLFLLAKGMDIPFEDLFMPHNKFMFKYSKRIGVKIK